MDSPPYLILFLFLAISVATPASAAGQGEDRRRRTYIIHMDKSAMPAGFSSHHDWYTATLSSLSSSSSDNNNIIPPMHLYTYNHVLDGFSAVLSGEHLHWLEKTPGHLATYPESYGKLHTTHTPKFLGLNKNGGAWPEGKFGDDMIIGILDSGVWPESESFKDKGMGPVPERWRGACESGVQFNSSYCNRKLIGARSFSKGMKQRGLNISLPDDYDSPRDFLGHGTHTSSTAAGSPVRDADYFGYAKGTATGIAPKARLAMYKVFFFTDMSDPEAAASDVLAGMDQAIADGVDLMSLSLGFFETTFERNPIAVGAFAAMEKGIFVSCSAGNAGPHGYTIFNGAPWVTTIGAGTIDRDYAADVTLGNGKTFRGKSVYPEDLFISNVTLYFGHGNESTAFCYDNSLDPEQVSGKVVFCDFPTDYGQDEVERVGATAAIFSTDTQIFLKPTDFYVPFVAVSHRDGKLVKDYILKTEDPVVDIKFQKTVLGAKPAPQVAWFSSRGPARRSAMILKPDLLAPGVDVLAAWVPNRGFAPIEDDYLLTDYALLSGTSMASPHAIGVATLLKSAHPDWSPAAIRSAMMTTASLQDNAQGTIIDMTYGVAGTPLDFGAGHINPNVAMDPGLIYDIDPQDYINFLCGLNYTAKQIKIITRRSKFSCDEANLDLNYPSFMVLLNNTNTTSFTFKRVLTNMEGTDSVYHASVKQPSGMNVSVQPSVLSFAGKYSKAEFNMTVEINLEEVGPESDYMGKFGFLTWREAKGRRVVRSPIVAAIAPIFG